MNKAERTIELIIDLHKDSDRQGPGGVQETRRALSMLDLPSDSSLKIADIGCGTGGQSITLAQYTNNAKIIAVDLFPQFLQVLELRAKGLKLDDRIQTMQCSMEKLTFQPGELDVIWSEGAIYNLGFEEGVKSWKSLLKTGGYLAVSEVTWITNFRPSYIQKFWDREYPEIDLASNKIRILENNGFTLVGYFNLKPECWMKNYYQPLQSNFTAFLDRHGNSDSAQAVVDEYQAEIKLYKEYGPYYSYGFYVAKKTADISTGH